MQGIGNAGSWLVAAEVVRAAPDLAVYETHPGGGMYDCLSLFGDGVRLEINREGSIHVTESPLGEAVPLLKTWTRKATKPGGARDLARQLLAAAGREWPDRRPPTTPRVLTYRVIARLLAARALDTPVWDVRSQFLDTSGGRAARSASRCRRRRWRYCPRTRSGGCCAARRWWPGCGTGGPGRPEGNVGT